MTTHVRSRAARDMACGEDDTRVIDSESGVYRVSACGQEASYQCLEDPTSLGVHCQRLYTAAEKGEPAPQKPQAGSSLAKSP